MGKRFSNKITLEQAIAECRPYKTRFEVASYSVSLIRIILHNHWEHECFAHMDNLGEVEIDSKDVQFLISSKHAPYTYDECEKICKKCKTQKELKQKYPKVYNCINYHYKNLKKQLFFNFVREQENSHTLIECMRIAALYSSASEMSHSEHNYILAYIRNHGWMVDCCSHFSKKYIKRTIPDAMEELQQYSSYQELASNNPKLLSFALRHGLEDVVLAGMLGYGERRKNEPFFDVSPLEGTCQRLTYKFQIPIREDIVHYMRIANNLYNQTIYEFRSALRKKDPQWLSHYSLREKMREMLNLEGECNYKLMPNDNMADRVIQSVALACNDYARRMREHLPGQAFPGLPGFRRKGGLFQLRFAQKKDGGRNFIRKNKVNLCDGIEITIPDFEKYRERLRHLVYGTIIPRYTHLEVALTYDISLEPDLDLNKREYAAIDIGLKNLITMVDRNQTTIYHGDFLKSYNQYYNDRLRKLRKDVNWQLGQPYTKRMSSLVANRNAYMHDVMHKLSRHIVDYLRFRHIGVLIIGWNSSIQQRSGLGGNVKRLFQLVPFGQLIDKLRYKCEQIGIQVITTEECHTSKCDALALEPLCNHEVYQGRRIHRGLFKSSTGRVINADVNGAINIMRKVIGDGPFIKDIINKGHLFCPVGYSNPFDLKPYK